MYQLNHYISKDDVDFLRKELGLSEDKIRNWFKRRRAKENQDTMKRTSAKKKPNKGSKNDCIQNSTHIQITAKRKTQEEQNDQSPNKKRIKEEKQQTADRLPLKDLSNKTGRITQAEKQDSKGTWSEFISTETFVHFSMLKP